MARLPVPGSDDGSWGAILNDFLSVEMESDGTLRIRTDGSLSNLARTEGDQTLNGIKTFTSPPVIPVPTDNNHAATKQYVDDTALGAVPDATTTSKGILQLAGDLSGTADAPVVPELANKEPVIAPGSTTQYWRGDKSWQTLDKAAIGLANVDNTSDTDKPISDAVATALDEKYDASNPAGYITAAGAPVQSVAGKTGTVSLEKDDVGLGNVDDTSDADKPVSNATQTALDVRVPKQSTDTSDPDAPLIRYTRNYAVDFQDEDIMVFSAGNPATPTAWLNEWGGYRARPFFNWDAGVRLIAHASQSGNIIEYQNNARTTTLWGINPQGYTMMSGIQMAPVLVLAPAASVPSDTPVGTVIIRTT